jgi:hypothetical protein
LRPLRLCDEPFAARIHLRGKGNARVNADSKPKLRLTQTLIEVFVPGRIGYHLGDLGSRAVQYPEERQVADEDRSDEISTDERRHFDRSRLIVDVHFDGADATGVASTTDISLGGLYMSTQAEIRLGAMLALRLQLGSEHVVVRGEVVYSNPGHGVGVKFHLLSEQVRALMERELPAP